MAAAQTSGARPLGIPATKHPDAPWNGSGYLQGLKVDIVQWLGWLTWIGLAVCIVALIMFGAALALDKERGEAISARLRIWCCCGWGGCDVDWGGWSAGVCNSEVMMVSKACWLVGFVVVSGVVDGCFVCVWG